MSRGWLRSTRVQLEAAPAASAALAQAARSRRPAKLPGRKQTRPTLRQAPLPELACAYSVTAGSGAGTIGRTGSLNSSAGAGLKSGADSGRRTWIAPDALCGLRSGWNLVRLFDRNFFDGFGLLGRWPEPRRLQSPATPLPVGLRPASAFPAWRRPREPVPPSRARDRSEALRWFRRCFGLGAGCGFGCASEAAVSSANEAAFGSSEISPSHSAEMSISLSAAGGSARTSNSLDAGAVEDAGLWKKSPEVEGSGIEAAVSAHISRGAKSSNAGRSNGRGRKRCCRGGYCAARRDGLGGGSLFVLAGQFAVAAGFVGMPGVVIKLFQIAAANRGFAEAARPGVQRGQALVQPQIAGEPWAKRTSKVPAPWRACCRKRTARRR